MTESKRFTPTMVGGTGLRRTRNRSDTYEEFLPPLRGLQNATTVYHQIRSNSPVIGASLHAIMALLRRAPFVLTRAGDKPRHQQALEIASTGLPSAMVRTLVADAANALTYGFALNEVLFRQEGRQVVVAKIPPRSPRSVIEWIWDDQRDEVMGFRQMVPGRNELNVDVPMNRCLHFRLMRGEADDPSGVSLLRSAYQSDYYARRLQEIEAIGIERDLTGLPMVRVPGEMLDPNATPEQVAAVNAFQCMLTDIRRDRSEGIIIPSDRDDQGNLYFDLQLMSVAGNRQVDVGGTIERYEKRMAQALLTDFLFLGVSGGGTGSFALSSDKTNMFALSLRCILDMVSDEIQRGVIGPLMRYNGITNPALWPTCHFGELEPPSVEELGEFLDRAARAGFNFTDLDTENRVREQAGLPTVTDQKPALNQPPADSAPEQSPDRGPGDREPVSLAAMLKVIEGV